MFNSSPSKLSGSRGGSFTLLFIHIHRWYGIGPNVWSERRTVVMCYTIDFRMLCRMFSMVLFLLLSLRALKMTFVIDLHQLYITAILLCVHDIESIYLNVVYAYDNYEIIMRWRISRWKKNVALLNFSIYLRLRAPRENDIISLHNIFNIYL